MIEYYENGQIYQGPSVLVPKTIPVFNYAQAMILGGSPESYLRTMDADWARVAFRAPAPTSDADVDLDSCAPRGGTGGADTLCAVWTDPDFRADQRAVYYARVVERPTCRWSTRECNALDPAERPPACAADDPPKLIRERAWTSPIWYAPPGE